MPGICCRQLTLRCRHALTRGTRLSPYAEELFGDLVRLGFSDFSEYQILPARTLDSWRDGANAVAQGRYEDGTITCISDIVSRSGDGYVLTEIKSGTSAKPEHTFDLAFPACRT